VNRVRVETQRDLALALDRLRRRDPAVLAAFILSLAQESGPMGDQVRTFFVGDDVAEAAKSIRERIRDCVFRSSGRSARWVDLDCRNAATQARVR
jgi:hypothetical protein